MGSEMCIRDSLTIAAIHGNPVAFGDCHSAFHQSPMPSESEPVYVHSWTLPRYVFARKLFKDSRFLLKPGPYTHRTLKVNDMSYNQLISDPSTYVKKRAQRSDDSILLRHMDDVVGTGPEEHLMSDFEHVKTCLYLADVVVI